MKKLFIWVVFIAVAAPGYALWWFSHAPNQDVYWYDPMTKAVRKITKGEFDSANQKAKWLSERDIEEMEIERNYHKFRALLDAMQQGARR